DYPTILNVNAMSKHRPTYEKMIEDAILMLNERRGSSRQAIKKYLFEKYEELSNIPGTNTRINTAIRKGVANGKFKYSKGPASRIGLVKKPRRKKEEPQNEDVKPSTSAAAATKMNNTRLMIVSPGQNGNDKPRSSVSPGRNGNDKPRSSVSPGQNDID
ncbi:6907_t:CDS:2, partial [Cetraspora pellucida]